MQEKNPNKKRKILIVFDELTGDIDINKKSNPIVTELFIRGRKLNISLVFINQNFIALWIFIQMYWKTIFLFGYWYYSSIR